jgi:hypothetical protein
MAYLLISDSSCKIKEQKISYNQFNGSKLIFVLFLKKSTPNHRYDLEIKERRVP